MRRAALHFFYADTIVGGAFGPFQDFDGVTSPTSPTSPVYRYPNIYLSLVYSRGHHIWKTVV